MIPEKTLLVVRTQRELTGTLSGIGIAMNPPGLLKGGDIIEAEVEGIGVLRNSVREVPHKIEG
jgi:hypothetical protein